MNKARRRKAKARRARRKWPLSMLPKGAVILRRTGYVIQYRPPLHEQERTMRDAGLAWRPGFSGVPGWRRRATPDV